MRQPHPESNPVRLTRSTLRTAAIVSGQFLLLFLALWALHSLIKYLSLVLIPVTVALLLTALMEPMVGWLHRHRWPRGLAVVATLLAGIAVVGGMVTFVVFAILGSIDELRRSVAQSVEQVQEWLRNTPLNLGGDLLQRAQNWLQGNQGPIASQALGAVSTVGEFVTGLVLALVLLVMFLYDGPRMWRFLLVPWRARTRDIIDDAGRGAYRSVVLYVRVTALIALIDAVGIGIGLAAVGVPLTVPLAAVVFLGAFVPYVGALVSGFLVVAVTLVSNGLVAALIILGVVLAVQQLEGQVLQPLLQGNFIKLHPAVVLVVLTIGAIEGGIVGVLLAVPATTALRAIVVAVAKHARE
ncbi:putative PurR-regulated permease PerM [Prauserella shujinwangii]|uniref:Putative PurR-regulated permease PerM n=1 Tax=Prauserella shujinwangii TaxID=1453103 RepID=A0A2T0LLE3_9PSEU|nr:AI-2E family transporter [Prauserella shujinwangii]PRX43704.1 putative PurR-regulated permease PerM [Prauserella shujinwangii]